MINIVYDSTKPNALEINGSLMNKIQVGEIMIQGDNFTIVKSNGAYWTKNTPWTEFSNNGVPFTSKEELKTLLKTFLGFKNGGGSGTGAVSSVTGNLVDNADPLNPKVNLPAGGTSTTFLAGDNTWKNPTTPSSINIGVNDAATRLPYVINGSFVSGGIQASRSSITNNIPIRSATGQIKANNAVEADDVITLGQFNNSLKKTVYPSDLGVTFNFGIPFKQSGSDIWGQLVMSQLVGNSTIPQRTGTGQLKCANASADDEAINLSQFKGIINNVLTASETSTTLNATYGSNPIGQVVRSINNNVEYTKISATQWKKETLSIV